MLNVELHAISYQLQVRKLDMTKLDRNAHILIFSQFIDRRIPLFICAQVSRGL